MLTAKVQPARLSAPPAELTLATRALPPLLTPNVAQSAAQARRTLSKVMRNSLLSVALAWLQTLCFSLGDVFSGDPAAAQSFARFLVAKMLWSHGFFCVVNLVLHFALIRQERLVDNPDVPPTFRQSAVMLLPAAIGFFLLTAVAIVASGLAIAQLPSAVHQAHLELYVGPFFSFLFVVAMHWKTRLLVSARTVRGRAWLIQRQMKMKHETGQIAVTKPRPLFVRVFCRDLPFMLSISVATAYVQMVGILPIKTEWQVFCFALFSLVTKTGIQELAKSHLRRQKLTPPVRSMAVVVATPTILIDTQVRTVLLCETSGAFTVMGSIVLAVVEVILRTAKAYVVKARMMRTASMQLQRRRSGGLLRARLTWDGRMNGSNFADVVMAARSVTSSQKLAALHTAEVIADMYAEYMAIGCSYGALFVLSDHAKFHQCAFNSTTTAASSFSVSWAVAATVAMQVSIEAVVDFVACALEAKVGFDFDQFNQDDAFFIVFMVSIAAANIGVTTGITLV